MKVIFDGCRGYFLIVLAVGIGLSGWARADTTETLPRGVRSFSLGFSDEHATREFSDKGGGRELGFVLNGLNLVEAGTPYYNDAIGALPGTVSVDQFWTDFDGEYRLQILEAGFAYGITDQVEAGVRVPYITQARMDAHFSARLWPTPAGTPGFDAGGLAQTTIKGRFGYRKINSWVGTPGVGDVTVWSKYRFADTEYLKAAVGTWLTLPTGQADDENDLMDIAYGGGCYAPAVFGMFDIVPVEMLTVNLTGRYIWNLPYERGVYKIDGMETYYDTMEFPTDHESGKYDPGDRFELETEVRLEASENFRVVTGYRYTQGYEDRINGHRMDQTEMIERKVWFGATLADRKPTADDPGGFEFGIRYEPVIAGRNTLQTERWAAMMKVYF